jgi:hypothetical protein
MGERTVTLIAEAEATETAVSSAATAGAGPESSSRRSGITEVDAVITAVLEGDGDALRERVRYITIACATVEGLGGPPPCRAGEAEGTRVDVFPALGPSLTYTRAEEIDPLLARLLGGDLYAVYEMRPGAYEAASLPAATHGVLFSGSNPALPVTIGVEQGSVVFVIYHMGQTGAEILARDAASILVAPPE